MRREKLPIVQLPVQPLIVNIATMSVSGCNRYYKLIRNKKNLSANIQERETVWHTELGVNYGVPFWNKVYDLTTRIKYDNRLKWIQYQVVRNSLFANHK